VRPAAKWPLTPSLSPPAGRGRVRGGALRPLFVLVFGMPLLVSGCGWTPLYADTEETPANTELRAIRVDPIAERIGQKLEIALRNSLAAAGEPTPKRYRLHTTLAVSRQDLGIQAQGLATRGKVDVYATYVLSDLQSGAVLLNNSTHSANDFDINANEYATVVGEVDAGTRTVEELDREIVARLTLFMQRRVAEGAAKPG